MFNWEVVKTYRDGGIAPDITRPIDHSLDPGLVAKIYKLWSPKKYGELIDYGGGVVAITIEMVYHAGEEFLISLPGIGPKRAAEILEKIEAIRREDTTYL